MQHDAILQALTVIFQEIFDDDDISLKRETTALDIEEWDSLNQIKIILACEKAFDVYLKPREISAMENIGDMVDHLHTLLSN
jgi:acyl carrier protein